MTPPDDDEALARLAKGMASPTRVKILRLLADSPSPVSPVKLAQVLPPGLGVVSYHVRTLKDLGLVELADEVPRRGAIEHLYRIAPGHLDGVRRMLGR